MMTTQWQESPSHDILTIPEVAGELRCSKAHIHNLINGRVKGARPLPALRLGRRRLILRTSIKAWLDTTESHEVQGTKSPEN